MNYDIIDWDYDISNTIIGWDYDISNTIIGNIICYIMYMISSMIS